MTVTIPIAHAAGLGEPDISITVHGIPAPQGSKRHLGGGVLIESSKKVKPWREAVKYAALQAIAGRPWQPLDGPLLVGMTLTFVRPKGHYRTGRNAHLLRDSAPLRPAVYPDLSKLARSTEDAITDAGIWRDDAQVVEYRPLAKRYAGDPAPDVLPHGSGAVIRIWRINPTATAA